MVITRRGTLPEPLSINHVNGQESSVQRFLRRAVRSHAIDQNVGDIVVGEPAGAVSNRNWWLSSTMHPIGARSVLETNVGRIQTNGLALPHTAAVVRLADLSNELDV